MSKYNPLWEYIKIIESKKINLSFDEIEKIVGNPIDHSFLTYKKELNEYGYKVEKISMKEKYIIFSKLD